MQVASGLPVHDDLKGAGLGVGEGLGVGIVDHQVNVERPCGNPPQRLDHRQAERQIGHEVPIHDVDVQSIRASGLAATDLGS